MAWRGGVAIGLAVTNFPNAPRCLGLAAGHSSAGCAAPRARVCSATCAACRRACSLPSSPAPLNSSSAVQFPSILACSDWKSRLGGHKLNDLMWELHRRGLVRAEERTSISGQRNLFFTNLRC